MRFESITIDGIKLPVISLNTVIVGTGCAGYNAADSLFALGQKDIAIVTEGVNMGTSRNTGSDKQTYYKLSLEACAKDSIMDMAKTLFAGGSMHGDIALAEAAISAKSFYKLVEAGVPFPHNEYGEYVGYKTDHDATKRATSAGPLTSKYMTEKLEASVRKKGIPILDGYRVIGIVSKKGGSQKSSAGLVAINLGDLENENMGLTVFNCVNIIYATGGPAGMYETSVYPESQTGASGIAFAVGAEGINLTESQYGIASTKFRWNLSGTYQQVIPRYISTDTGGKNEREFLDEYFPNTQKMLNAIFLKGYQWPFDPRKIADYGSSLIDILVYIETQIKGRRVFLDYTHNPYAADKNGELDSGHLSEEGREYLKNSGVLFGKPIDRLKKMNMPAYELYLNHGIDLAEDYLEIAVCAQHNNGGLKGNIWWESNIKHFFPVGEANGTFGVYRPGGSALNSTQVGSFRAAQYINSNYSDEPIGLAEFTSFSEKQISGYLQKAKSVTGRIGSESDVFSRRCDMQQLMTKYGAHIRSKKSIDESIETVKEKLSSIFDDTKISDIREYHEVFINYDILVSQFVYLNAYKKYIADGGKSRGSYLVYDEAGILPIKNADEMFRYSLDNGEKDSLAYNTKLDIDSLECKVWVEDVRPIPQTENWFENVWNDYMQNKIIR